MKTIKYLGIIFISQLLFWGCEQTEIVNPDIEYKEYTVVRAELKAGKDFEGVRFTKTLPLEISYDINLAELKNVVAYIKVDGAQVIPLHYSKEGIYIPKYIYKIEAGRNYELFARTEGKIIYSSTYVPQKPAIVSSSFNTADYYYLINLKPQGADVYGAVWVIDRAMQTMPDDFFSLSGGEITSPGTVIAVRTPTLPEEYRGGAYQGRRLLKVFAFDKSYQDFFKSRDSNKPVGDAFAQGRVAVKWNVEGEKTIGLFMGVNESELIIPSY